jgi:cell division protein FtsL
MNAKVKTHQDVNRTRLIDNKIFFLVVLMLIFVATLVGYMYIRNGLDALIARNLSMKSSNAQLQQDILYLETEIIDLSRPGHIQELAHEKLGLVNSPPQAEAIFVKKRP